MQIQIDWRRPMILEEGPQGAPHYSVNLDRVPEIGGIYVFARRWGNGFEALYVGQGTRLQTRIAQQFNNLRLMSHIQRARTGDRLLFLGEVITRPGQRMATCLNLVERSLIRYFLSEGHDLVNRQGARFRRHEITSAHRTRGFVPALMYLEH